MIHEDAGLSKRDAPDEGYRQSHERAPVQRGGQESGGKSSGLT